MMDYIVIAFTIVCFLCAISMVVQIVNIVKEKKERDALEIELAQCEYDISKCIEKMNNLDEDITKMTDEEYSRIMEEVQNLCTYDYD